MFASFCCWDATDPVFLSHTQTCLIRHRRNITLFTGVDGKVYLENGFAPTLDFLDRANFREPPPDRKNAFQDLMNAHVGLPAIHTLVLREHNRVCDVLRAEYPHFSDDGLFETARNSVVNTLLHVFRSEYMSTLLGRVATSSVQMGPNVLTRRLGRALRLEAGESIVSPEYLLTYVFHTMVEETTRPEDAATAIRTEEWFSDALGAVDAAYPYRRSEAFESLMRYGSASPCPPHGMQTVHGTPVFMHPAILYLMDLQAANDVVGYNEARRRLGLVPYASMDELVRGTSLDRVEMDGLFGGDVEAVDFYTGITIDNSKLSGPELLCEASRRIISGLALGFLPAIQGSIQSLLPPCILSEVRACRKSGFLSTLLRHHLPSLRGAPVQWTMGPLKPRFYTPPQKRVSADAEVCLRQENEGLARDAIFTIKNDDGSVVSVDAGAYLTKKKKKGLFKGLFKEKKGLARDTSITRKYDDDSVGSVNNVVCLLQKRKGLARDTSFTQKHDNGSVGSVNNTIHLPQKRKGLARDTSFIRNDSVGSVDNGVYLLQKRKGLVRDTSFTKMNDDDSCAACTQYFDIEDNRMFLH